MLLEFFFFFIFTGVFFLVLPLVTMKNLGLKQDINEENVIFMAQC